jgi:hypothetical protein
VSDSPDQTAVDEARKSAERYERWRDAYDEGTGRPIDQAQEEVITLSAEVTRLREVGFGHVDRAARIEAERDRYKKALEHIKSADCWNSRVTAQDALKGGAS